MKPRKLILLGLATLLLGALASIAVAWGCARWSRAALVVEYPNQHTMNDPAPWPAPVPVGWPRTASIHGPTYTGPGLTVRTHVWPARPGGPAFRQEVVAAGLPFRCTELTVQYRIDHSSTRVGWSKTAALSFGRAGQVAHFPGPSVRMYDLLPTRPRWAGLLANSIIHGTVLMLLIRALFRRARRVLRARRARRGACLACGYNRAGIAGDVACPECGMESAPAAIGATPA